MSTGAFKLCFIKVDKIDHWCYFNQNFAPIFSYESVLYNSPVLTLWVCNFVVERKLVQFIAHEMLVKLTNGVNFTKILRAPFCQNC